MAGAGLVGKLYTPAVIASTGTAVPWNASHTEFQSLMIQADPANSANVYIGDSTVTSANGISLAPGEKLGIDGIRREPGNDSDFLDEWFLNGAAGDALRIINLVRR